MKAIEAAEHSDVIWRTGDEAFLYYRSGYNWYYRGVIVDLEKMAKDDYVPLVPKKIYKVGDKVTFLEALNSGMCFKIGKSTAKIQNNRCYFWATDHWGYVGWGLNEVLDETCTICDDPSIPPKPTLESLPAWTRCKVKPVNYTVGICDVIKKPGGSFEYYDSGNGFGFVNIELISIYNPKADQWECV